MERTLTGPTAGSDYLGAINEDSTSSSQDTSTVSVLNDNSAASGARNTSALLNPIEEIERSDASTGLAQPEACNDKSPARPEACDGESKHGCCECRHKNTERSEELQSDIQKRLNRAIGQLNGVKSMIEDNRYCGDVLTQLAAAESAVHRTAEIILQNHMETCVVEQIRAGNVEVVDEAMKLMRKFM